MLMVAPLLKAGADVNLRAPDPHESINGAAGERVRGALHIQTVNSRHSQIKGFLRGFRGATALFVAALHGHSEIVAALMKAGADTRVKGPGGKTAADVARMKYGTLAAARKRKENAFVIGLLRGKTGRQIAEEQRLLAKKEFRDCNECPEMVVVPSGSFAMGSPSSEPGRHANEGPRHVVTIQEPFAVGKYEVTFLEWDACVAAGGCNGYRPDDEGFGRGRHPVISVNWKDAKSYAKWLSRKTGKQYRLLSEAEWEYVARAGTTGPFHFGLTISTDQANYRTRTYGSDRKEVYRRKTVPVGSFPPNRFGLHDVHGNVWEWVQDCWHDNYRGAPADGSAWTRGGDCAALVLRGGSWDYYPKYLRAGNRNRGAAGDRFINNGFRVARSLSS